MPQGAGELAPTYVRMYEAQQPPAYYFLLAPLYYVVKDVQLLERCWILRAASVLLASAVIPLGYLLALRCVQPEIGIGIVCVIAAMPELFISISRISNEFLAVPIGTLVLLLTVLAFTGRHGSGTGLGVVLGLALLTKAYFLAFVPVVALAQAWASQSHPLRRLTRTLAPIGIAVLFAGGTSKCGTSPVHSQVSRTTLRFANGRCSRCLHSSLRSSGFRLSIQLFCHIFGSAGGAFCKFEVGCITSLVCWQQWQRWVWAFCLFGPRRTGSHALELGPSMR